MRHFEVNISANYFNDELPKILGLARHPGRKICGLHFVNDNTKLSTIV